MADASPAPVAVELYNRLVKLPPSDVTTIGQIEWRLRMLRQKRPGDGEIGVALLQASLLLGHITESIRLVEQLWPARFTFDPQVLATFAALLAEVGQYERALSLVLPKGSLDLSSMREAGRFTIVACGWALGDLPLVRSAVNVEQSAQLRHPWTSALDRIEGSGIAPLFAKRQQIVREMLAGRQCFLEIMPTRDDEGQFEIVQYSYISADHEQRIELEEAIHFRLREFYTASGLDGDPDFGVTQLVVADVTAGPPHLNPGQFRVAA